METYPKNTKDFEKRFKDDESCLAYIYALRWPDGFVCPFCQSKRKAWLTSKGKVKCGDCGKSISVTSGTIFQDSHTPLHVWFRIMWHLCLQKNGLSALGMQRSLGMGTYQTSWLCLHKLRKAMVRPGRERLEGIVEVDEAFIGGEREGRRGRGIDGKVLTLVAVEDKSYWDEVAGRRRRLLGRIRLCEIDDASNQSLLQAIKENIEPGAVVRTDGWAGYANLEEHGYIHEIQKPSSKYKSHAMNDMPFDDNEIGDYDSPLPNCHLVISLLKRWILGTLQGSMGKDYAQDYFNEFTFRFNRRNSKFRGMLFWRLAQLAVEKQPDTLKNIKNHKI